VPDGGRGHAVPAYTPSNVTSHYVRVTVYVHAERRDRGCSSTHYAA
jgi:hypothetical protein